jgi:HD-like signal output (HDOD) protein
MAARTASAGLDAASPQDNADAERQRRLAAILRSIAESADFVTVRDSMVELQRLARSEQAHVRALSNQIGNDVAITSKLLRVINAAYYATAGGGQITSLNRAVALMGFQTVGMLAGSLMLFERLPKTADGDKLREDFSRGQLAALLAHEMCHSGKSLDNAYLAAQFQGLGDMLGALHFPQDRAAIDRTLDERQLSHGSAERAAAREHLARQRWGLGFEDIGAEVAGQWGWPEALRHAMKSLLVPDTERACTPEEYLRVLVTASNRLADALMRLPPAETPQQQAEARLALVVRFAKDHTVPLSLNRDLLPASVERMHGVWQDLVRSLGVEMRQGRMAVKSGLGGARAPTVEESLTATLNALSALIDRGGPTSEVLRLLMKQIHEVLQLDRLIICLAEPSGAQLTGRHALGARALALAPLFQIGLRPPRCLFGLLTTSRADTLISDVRDPTIEKRMPDWHLRQVRARSFIVLPMATGTRVLGMIYGDKLEPGALKVGERELALLKSIRAQAVRALAVR